MKKIGFIIWAFTFFSCQKKEIQSTIPNTILSIEKTASVLTEIHLSEANTNAQSISDSFSKKNIDLKNILKEHQITQSQYDSSISFYINRPELFNKVYEGVLNNLNKKNLNK